MDIPERFANSLMASRSADAIRVLNLISFFISFPPVFRKNWVWGSAPQTSGRRAAALPVTRQTRCWPSSEATAHPSLPTEVKSSLAPCFLLSPEKPLRWVSPGAPFEVILPRRAPAFHLRPQAAQHGASFALREFTRCPRKPPANRRTTPQQGQQGRPPGHPGYRHFRHGAAQ